MRIEPPNNNVRLCTCEQYQTTLKAPFTLNGIGIFSGKAAGFTAKPADINTGIVFIVNDVSIPAEINLVEEIPNRTKISKSDVSVQVVEHLLSAFSGLGVDNVIIEVESDELPILDASAKDYVHAILDAGIVEQEACADELVIETPIGIEERNVSIWLMPDAERRITYFLDHEHPAIGKMSDSLVLNPDNYRDLIGPARTFATEEEARILIEENIVGTDDRSLALVVGKDGPNQELRNPLEFVHHKMLDMIGDMSLAHPRIRGHLIGIRSGHFMNRKLARVVKSLLLS